MTNKECYKIWASFDKKWVDWVRPVSFIKINEKIKHFQESGLKIISFDSIKIIDKDMAIIVDLPGTKSIEVGIILAKLGYRPIPIYNGTIEQKGARATTDNSTISSALVWGAHKLINIKLLDNANPAFLVDKNRLERHRIDNSIFDNSWDVYHQDLPTEEYFLNNGITKILVISDNLSKDLKKIFKGYSKKKLSILLTNGYEEPKVIIKGK